MKQSVVETINATPAELWPFLQPNRWHTWLAADGPLPALESVAVDGNRVTATASDGQIAVYTIDRSKPDRLLEYSLERQDNAPWPVHLVNTLQLDQTGPDETDVIWECEWYRDTNGWRDLLVNWLINGELLTMMDLSIWNLKLLVEENKNDDNLIAADDDTDTEDSDFGVD